MLSAKDIGFIVVILILLASAVWLYKGKSALEVEAAAILDALALSEMDADFEKEINELTQQLREEQSERTRQTERAETLSYENQQQHRQIAELEIKVRALETEVRRSKLSTESVASTATVTTAAAVAAATQASSSADSAGSGTTVQSTTATEDYVREGEVAATGDGFKVHDIEYVIKPGDLLTELALTYYGDSTMWRQILAANRDVVSDVRSLRPGMKLIIPNVPR